MYKSLTYYFLFLKGKKYYNSHESFYKWKVGECKGNLNLKSLKEAFHLKRLLLYIFWESVPRHPW